MNCTFKGPHFFDSVDRYRDYQCKREAEFGSLCLFHVEKSGPGGGATDMETTRSLELDRRCEAEFAELLEKLFNDPDVTKCDFRGFQLSSLILPTTVPKALDFRDSQFDVISLDGGDFLGSVDFSTCKFKGMASFACTFREPVDFSNAEFNYPPFFVEAKFRSSAKFWATKLKSPWFKNASFSSVDFFMAEVEGKAAFDEATFSSVAHFAHTKFNGDAGFSKAVFESASSFQSSVFSAAADFRGCIFQTADFSGASFLKQASFSNAVFRGPASFAQVKLDHELHFVNDADANESGFHDECNFRSLSIRPGARVIFRDTNLERASFLYTDLTDFSFSDVNWHCHYHSRFWSRATLARSLYDQFRLEKQIRDFCEKREVFKAGSLYEALAENYRQLVLNYEEKRDFETAEDFHVGEMEMRRKKKGAPFKGLLLRTVREWLNEYGLYRISSAYGTSYLQASTLLLVFLLLFSIAFLYSGFRPVSANGEAKPPIEYNVFSDAQHQRPTLKQWLQDYNSAVSLSLSIITFQKDRFYEPLEGWSRFWLYIAIVVLTAQGALVLLAIRRRFKR